MLGEYYETGTDPISKIKDEIEQHIKGTNGHEGDHDGRYYPRVEIDPKINKAGGFVQLDALGKLPASVAGSLDDVLAYDSATAFPSVGEDGILYIAKDSNKGYRYNGAGYTVVSNPLVLGETHTDAYRGDRGKIAYDHSKVASGNPHKVTKTDVGLDKVDNTADADKPISTDTKTALEGKEDIFTKNTAFNKDFGDDVNEVARGNHNHDNVYLKIDTAQNDYEPIFTKNTAFNKDFGKGTNEVARGDHTHPLPTLPFDISNYQQTKDKGVPNGYAPLDASGKVPKANLPTSASSAFDVNGITVNTDDRVPQTALVYNGTDWEYRPFPNFNTVASPYGNVMVLV